MFLKNILFLFFPFVYPEYENFWSNLYAKSKFTI